MITIKINTSNLLNHFNRFSAEVNDGKYKKINYNIWREFKTYLNSSNQNEIKIEKNEQTGMLYISPSFEFSIRDNSFGQYLNEHLIFTSLEDTNKFFKEAIKAEIKSNLSENISNKSTINAVSSFEGIPIYEAPTGSLENSTFLVNRKSDKIYTETGTINGLFNGNNYHYNDKTEDIPIPKTNLDELSKINSSVMWGSNTPTYVSSGFDEVRTNLEILSNDMKNIKKDIYTLQSPFDKGNDKNKENKNEKEKNMFNFNFDFGVVDGEKVRMSPYGMAIQNREGTFVSYDAENDKITNVDVFNFDGSKFMYKMPVALSAVQKGDIVIHNHKPMFVIEVQGNRLNVVDVYEGESKAVIPTTNMFGFDFVVKIVSFIDMVGTPSKDNPFGNMLPFLMMGDNGNGNDNDFLMAMAMSQMNTSGNMFQNPMFMLALMGDDKGKKSNNDMLRMMVMFQMFAKPVVAPAQDVVHKTPPVVVDGIPSN